MNRPATWSQNTAYSRVSSTNTCQPMSTSRLGARPTPGFRALAARNASI